MRDVKGTLKGETETNYLDGLGVDGGSFSRAGWGHGLDRSASGQGEDVGSFEWGKKLPSSIKCGNFLSS